jgi:hypothetical protein
VGETVISSFSVLELGKEVSSRAQMREMSLPEKV